MMAYLYEIGDIIKLKKSTPAAALNGRFCASARISV